MNNNKKKIAFVLPSLNGGGAEKVFINLAIYFSKKNFEVTLLTINKKKDYNIELSKYKINFICLNKSRLIFSILDLIIFFSKNKFDLILSTILHINILMFFLNKLFLKQKLILRESNNIILNIKNKNFVEKFIYNTLISFVYKYSHLIAPSSDLKYNLIKNYNLDPKKVITINNPISIKFTEIYEIENFISFLKKFGINGNEKTKIILSIGSLTDQKNHIQIIKAFSKLKNISNLKLIILGKGPLKNDLLKYIKDYNLVNNVFLVGFYSEVELFLKYSNLYVCSSLWEGFPNALIDAASFNIPIISNNCDFGPSEILERGKFGGLCNPNDSKEMAQLIQSGLNGKIKIIPKDNFVSKYNIDIIAKKYEKLLNV